MSKKKFTDGLESLFNDSPVSKDEQGNILLFPIEKESKKSQEGNKPSKNFASNLDSFLQEAFNDVFEESKAEEQENTKKGKRPLTGLDALIRSTLDDGALQIKQNKNTKRLTLLVDQDKLDKLRNIAKQEKTYVKDIVSKIVEEYISKYDKE